MATTSDISGGKIDGAQPGMIIYFTDTKTTSIVNSDQTLSDYVLPFGASVDIGDVTLLESTAKIGQVAIDQTTPGTTNKVSTVLLAGEAHAGEVSGSTAVISVTPAITAGAYVANDCIGGKQEIALAARISGAPITLQSLVITDLAIQNAAINIFVFAGNPATGTYTDGDELDLDDTDFAQLVGIVKTGDGEWTSAKDNSIFQLTNIGLVIDPLTTSIYAIAKVTGTPTYASVADLTFKYGFFRD